MDHLPHLADQFLNRPLFLLPSQLATLATMLDRRIGEGAAAPPTPIPNASRFVGSSTARDPASGTGAGLPYRRTAEGVAIIPLLGSTLNRGAWIGSYYGLTTYEGLKFQLAHAAADPGTRSVILDMESPGGAAVGCFEAADAVRQLSARKPVVAVVNGMATSAAYAVASAATRIVTTPSGISGSIGVVMLHVDYSGALSQAGVKPTLVFAGAHKVDGNPYEPLPDGVRDDLRAEIAQFYDAFVGCVASGRANLSAAAIRATEARTFIGAAAVAVGLADAVSSFEGVLADLSAGRIAVGMAQAKPTGTAPPRTSGGARGAVQPGAYSPAELAAQMNAGRGHAAGLDTAAIYAARRAPAAEPVAAGRAGSARPAPAQSGAEPWDAIVAELNAAAGLAHRGTNAAAIYADRRRQGGSADAGGEPAPRQRAAGTTAGTGAMSPDAIADQLNAEKGLTRPLGSRALYAARRAQAGDRR